MTTSTFVPAPTAWHQRFFEEAIDIIAAHREVPFTAMAMAACSSVAWPVETPPEDDRDLIDCNCGEVFDADDPNVRPLHRNCNRIP